VHTNTCHRKMNASFCLFVIVCINSENSLPAPQARGIPRERDRRVSIHRKNVCLFSVQRNRTRTRTRKVTCVSGNTQTANQHLYYYYFCMRDFYFCFSSFSRSGNLNVLSGIFFFFSSSSSFTKQHFFWKTTVNFCLLSLLSHCYLVFLC
jgi:hypothetical protein